MRAYALSTNRALSATIFLLSLTPFVVNFVSLHVSACISALSSGGHAQIQYGQGIRGAMLPIGNCEAQINVTPIETIMSVVRSVFGRIMLIATQMYAYFVSTVLTNTHHASRSSCSVSRRPDCRGLPLDIRDMADLGEKFGPPAFLNRESAHVPRCYHALEWCVRVFVPLGALPERAHSRSAGTIYFV